MNCDRNQLNDVSLLVVETPENEALPNITFELSDVILNAAHHARIPSSGTDIFFPVNTVRGIVTSEFKLFKGVTEVEPPDTTLVPDNFASARLSSGTLTLTPSNGRIDLADIDYETVDRIEMTVNLRYDDGDRRGRHKYLITNITLEYHITDDPAIYLTSAADPKTIDYLTVSEDGVFLSLTEMDLTLDGLSGVDASQLEDYTVEEVREDGTLLTGPNVFTYDDDASGLVVVNGPWNTLRADQANPSGAGRFTGIVGKTYTVTLSATHPALTTLGLEPLMVDVVVNCDRNHIIDGTPTIDVGTRTYRYIASTSTTNTTVVSNQTNVLYGTKTPEHEPLPNIAFELSDVHS